MYPLPVGAALRNDGCFTFLTSGVAASGVASFAAAFAALACSVLTALFQMD